MKAIITLLFGIVSMTYGYKGPFRQMFPDVLRNISHRIEDTGKKLENFDTFNHLSKQLNSTSSSIVLLSKFKIKISTSSFYLRLYGI